MAEREGAHFQDLTRPRPWAQRIKAKRNRQSSSHRRHRPVDDAGASRQGRSQVVGRSVMQRRPDKANDTTRVRNRDLASRWCKFAPTGPNARRRWPVEDAGAPRHGHVTHEELGIPMAAGAIAGLPSIKTTFMRANAFSIERASKYLVKQSAGFSEPNTLTSSMSLFLTHSWIHRSVV